MLGICDVYMIGMCHVGKNSDITSYKLYAKKEAEGQCGYTGRYRTCIGRDGTE